MRNPQPVERSPSGKKELEDLSGCPDSAFSSCPQDLAKKDVCGRSPASLHLGGSPGSTTPLRKRKLPVPRCLQSSCCSPTLHQYRPRLGGALFGTGSSGYPANGLTNVLSFKTRTRSGRFASPQASGCAHGVSRFGSKGKLRNRSISNAKTAPATEDGSG